MPSFTDQLGRTIVLPQTPSRIISLVPSQTELLYTLGLGPEVVGITRFCIHPAHWFRHKTRIGGTKDIHPERIDALQPHLLIANKEENHRQQIEALAARYPVWVSDIHTLPDALHMITAIGDLTGRTEQARHLAIAIQQRFDTLSASFRHTADPDKKTPAMHTRPRCAYLIWRNPWMAAGGDTFIHDMLHRSGFTNVFEQQTRYPVITPESLAAADCDTILLSSEPYPFKEQHIQEIKAVLPHSTVLLVDGELFSWYGSRLLQAPAYFARLQQELAKYPQ